MTDLQNTVWCECSRLCFALQDVMHREGVGNVVASIYTAWPAVPAPNDHLLQESATCETPRAYTNRLNTTR